MFTLEIDQDLDSLTLKFEDHNRGIKICCNPEDITCLIDDGFDSSPSNGDFYFYKQEEKFVFVCAKYGNGLGGRLEISFDATPEINESFTRVMNEWKTFLNNREEEEL